MIERRQLATYDRQSQTQCILKLYSQSSGGALSFCDRRGKRVAKNIPLRLPLKKLIIIIIYYAKWQHIKYDT